MKLLFTGPNPNPSPNPSPYSDVYHCVMVDLRAGGPTLPYQTDVIIYGALVNLTILSLPLHRYHIVVISLVN